MCENKYENYKQIYKGPSVDRSLTIEAVVVCFL